MEKREYIDKEREVMHEYYELYEKYEGKSMDFIKRKMKELIKKDPDFLDPYLILYDILNEEGKTKEAEELLDEAYRRAINLITNEEGDWPSILEWSLLENRHIIRTILYKAILLWKKGDVNDSLDLFRKLLKTNPVDNVGARFYILAIRMGMNFEEFENRFNKDGFYDSSLFDWFDENYRKFPDEFNWWEKEMEKYE